MAKKEKAPPTQRYVVLNTLASDAERWLPGALIELTDERAAIHLAAGNVAPLEGTEPPSDEVGPAVIIHTAETTVEQASE